MRVQTSSASRMSQAQTQAGCTDARMPPNRQMSTPGRPVYLQDSRLKERNSQVCGQKQVFQDNSKRMCVATAILSL